MSPLFYDNQSGSEPQRGATHEMETGQDLLVSEGEGKGSPKAGWVSPELRTWLSMAGNRRMLSVMRRKEEETGLKAERNNYCAAG